MTNSKFYLLIQLEKMLQKVKRQLLIASNQQPSLMISQIDELIQFKQSSESSIIQKLYMKQKADTFMIDGNYEFAAIFLKALIQNDVIEAESQPFLGLGSAEEEKGFCQNKGYNWYKNKYGEISLFDQLAICFLKSPNFNAQKQWYNRLLAKVSNSYKVLFGMAVSEHNADHEKTAFSLYEKVAQLNPQFAKSYLMMAFLELKAKDEFQAQKYASIYLLNQPKSIHAKFIIVRARKITIGNTLYEQEMLSILLSEPLFMRAYYQVGCIFSKQNPKKAMQYFKKCIQTNSHFTQAIMMLEITKMTSQEDYQYGKLSLFSKTFQQLPNKCKSVCFFELACYAQNKQGDYCAPNYLKKCIELDSTNWRAVLKQAKLKYKYLDYLEAFRLCKFGLQVSFNEIRVKESLQSSVYLLNVYLARSQAGLNNYLSALEILKYCKNRFPEQISTDYLLGDTYFLLQNIGQALKYYQICLKSNNNVQNVHKRISMMYKKQLSQKDMANLNAFLFKFKLIVCEKNQQGRL